ncbi:chemotaxis signal transduction protein [Burkholderiales bacterium JOSHI_001]|nr:chemotaxis signal transduction protein [Burkholderiales bacterium JOSHI_001]
MAKKDALRDLQNRLALRMQQAREEKRATAWLAVDVAGQGLLFPLQQAGEIFDADGILPVPHTRAWFAGVANLRGGLHGVVDFAAFLGLRPHEAARDGAHLIALNPNLGLNCALLVDRLAGLRQRDELEPLAATPGPLPAFAGARWRDTQGRTWQEIELAALAADGQFLAIAG